MRTASISGHALSSDVEGYLRYLIRLAPGGAASGVHRVLGADLDDGSGGKAAGYLPLIVLRMDFLRRGLHVDGRRHGAIRDWTPTPQPTSAGNS